jgi:molybdate transport system substrate-binding protein
MVSAKYASTYERRAAGFRAFLLSFFFSCVLGSWSNPLRAGDVPVVAAASDLQFALEVVRKQFEARTGKRIKLSFGSSGNFASQIRHGAPVELYFSADESYALALAREGYAFDEGRLYAEGRLAILIPHGSPLKSDGSLRDLSRAIDDGRLGKFAIANPDHAPYGRRAMEVLQRLGLWGPIKARLVLGENVSQAAQFSTSGSAHGGIVAYSLVLAPEISRLGTYDLIPADWHRPLRQRMVLMKDAGPTARRFYAFVASPDGQETLGRFGFSLPAVE